MCVCVCVSEVKGVIIIYFGVHADENISFGKTVVEAIPFGPLPVGGFDKTSSTKIILIVYAYCQKTLLR